MSREVDIAKADAVRVYRERLFERLRRMRLAIEGDERSQPYRTGWNHCLDNLERDL
jgi:hypothetical protein